MLALAEKRGQVVNLGHPRDPGLGEMFGAYERTVSGAQVTPANSLRQTAVFACVRIATQTMSGLPVAVYERSGDEKRMATEHPLHRLLRYGPNPAMTRAEFFQAMQPNLELHGNAFAHIEWGGDGYPKALWPWSPDRVRVQHNGIQATYEFRTANMGTRSIPARDVLHIKTFAVDGFMGRSAIRYAREAVGLSQQAEEFGAKYFSQGMHAGGVVQVPGKLNDDGRRNLRKGIQEFHEGVDRAHRTMVLWDGASYTSIGINPNDMQFLDTRKFQIAEIARLFGWPLHMLAELDRSTNNNIEHQGIEMVVHGVQPRTNVWEQALSRALIPERDRERYFVEFNIDGLLRGDIKSRYEAHAIAINTGFKTRNEVRKTENLTPLDGLDEILEPLNMTRPGDGGMDATDGSGYAKRWQVDFETREARAQGRKGLRESFRPMFREAMGRIVKREVREIRKALTRFRNQHGAETRSAPADLGEWLENFYREFGADVRDGMSAPVNAMADAVGVAVLNELGETARADIGGFVDAYLEALSVRHVGSSMNQLRKLLQSDAFEAEVERRLEGWLDTRADKAAQRETTQLEGGAARAAMTQLGVRKFRWVNVGATCPLCRELNGRIVGANDPFAREGEWINPNRPDQDREDDEKVSIVLKHHIFHPPLHDGCDCILLPEF